MKQRLVGAVVLVSLAVIFIPMLLDGGDKEGGMPLFGSNIPEKPDYQFEPLEIPLEPVEQIPEERPLIVAEQEPAAVEAQEEDKPTKPLVEAAAPEPSPESRASAEQPEAVGWVVQVGSFSQSANALGLRDKLRAKGFTTFVEKLKTDSGTVYRVRIGPELKREDAEAQLAKLQREMNLKGIVMGHGS